MVRHPHVFVVLETLSRESLNNSLSHDEVEMASQEQIPASLPDTQNADAILTQEVSSQQPTLAVWGRLCPLRSSMKSLGKNLHVFRAGRDNALKAVPSEMI